MRLLAGDVLLAAVAAMGLVFAGCMVHAAVTPKDFPAGRAARAIGVSDPALNTAARYLRHASLADIMTPFMDAPASLEHFPAGSVFPPPPYLSKPLPYLSKPLP